MFSIENIKHFACAGNISSLFRAEKVLLNSIWILLKYLFFAKFTFKSFFFFPADVCIWFPDQNCLCCSCLCGLKRCANGFVLLRLSHPRCSTCALCINCNCARSCTCVPCSQTLVIPGSFAWVICGLEFINLSLWLFIICAVWVVS